MIGRLLKGILLGVLFGGIAAAVLIKGLAITSFAASGGALLAFASALVLGAVLGLVAGKPIWADGAKIEALLKTFFGALLAAGGMFALRKFANVEVDLTKLGLGAGPVADLPALTLPAIAVVLSAFFEVDNTGGEPATPKEGTRARVEGKAPNAKLRAPAPAKARAGEALGGGDDEALAPRKAKK
jgi:hypothetical protein